MTDSIQNSSSIPLPSYQTGANARDPVPVSSPTTVTKTTTERANHDAAVEDDAFKTYLDRSEITVVEKAKSNPDAADLVTQASVYGTPASKTPL